MPDMKDCFVKTSTPSPWEIRKAEPYVGEDGIYMPLHEYIYEGTATEYKMIMSKELFQEAFKEYIQKEGLVQLFKVKNKITGEIIQVLDTHCDEYGGAWFLIWANDGWRWRAANNFVPPNYMPKKKVIVAGSRTFQNYSLLCKELDKIKEQIDEVVCGEARGADTLGRNWAYGNGIKIKSFPADWQKYGQCAGMIRNSEMADYADCLIAFWDGQSAGTQDMIDKMEKRGKEVHVIYYDKPRTD